MLRRLVLWLFHRWFVIKIRPVEVEVGLFTFEGRSEPEEMNQRALTKGDFILAVSKLTDAHCCAIVTVLRESKVAVVLEEGCTHAGALADYLANNSPIILSTQVQKGNVLVEGNPPYEIEKRVPFIDGYHEKE